MKADKPLIASSDTELLRQDTPDTKHIYGRVKRVSHPTLATAILHALFRPKSPVADVRIINGSEPSETGKGKPAVASEWISFLDAVNTENNGSIQTLHILPTERIKPLDRLHKIELFVRWMPKRLIIALCLFIAAVILGFIAPRPPL